MSDSLKTKKRKSKNIFKLAPMVGLGVLFGLFQHFQSLNADGSRPQSAPSPLFSILSGASPIPSPSPTVAPLTAAQQAENQALLLEFHHAQKSQLKALAHRFKFELKELKVSQEARRKEWEKKEKEARYKFFAEHPQGKERRIYIGDFIKRRDEFLKRLKEELIQRAQEQETHLKWIQKEQSENLKALKASLAEGKKPGLELWPKAGQ